MITFRSKILEFDLQNPDSNSLIQSLSSLMLKYELFLREQEIFWFDTQRSSQIIFLVRQID